MKTMSTTGTVETCWARCAEMGAAMFVPAIALIALHQVGTVSGGALLSWQHALMLPSMVLVMLYRHEEYAR